MIHNETSETATDFPVSNEKIGKHSTPNKATKRPAPTATVSKYQYTTTDKALQLLTSLPVTTCILTAILSQGISLSGDLWYINYMAVCISLLIAAAISISLFSVSSSTNFCEWIFLSIYTPCSSIFGIQLNHRDVFEDEATRKAKLAQAKTPTWLKHFLFTTCVSTPVTGASVQSVIYTFAITLTYKLLSSTLKTFKGMEEEKAFRLAPKVTQMDRLNLLFSCSLVVLDLASCLSVGMSNLAFFLCTESTIINEIENFVLTKNFEYMEGLDEYYTIGLVYITEVTLSLYTLTYGPRAFLFMLPLIYFNVYRPTIKFREAVQKIKSESLCLANFTQATTYDIQQYDDVCAVCLSAMSHARITPCKHIFHGKCLKNCLKKKSQCPMCNTQLL